jgi:predicted transcriptional regulator YdeE
MDIEVIASNFRLNIYGFGAIAENRDCYARTAFQLSGKMWEAVKASGLKNKGKNIWVYDSADRVFAGVELDNPEEGIQHGLQEMKINLGAYAYCRHTGPFNRLKQAGQEMIRELAREGYEVMFPSIEIYGHWTGDENQSETELLMCVKQAEVMQKIN